MREIKTLQSFLSISAERPVVLYGAGQIGKVVYKFLDTNNIPVHAFVVTALEDTGSMNDVPIYSLANFLIHNQQKDFAFFLTVTGTYRDTIREELKKREIDSYFVLSDILLYRIAAENRKYAAAEAEMKKEKRRKQITVGYMTPGYYDSDYAEKRLIIGKIADAFYCAIPKETIDFPYAEIAYDRSPNHYHQLTEACYYPIKYKPETDLLHTFNAVCDTDIPWCASFETSIPRMRYDSAQEKEYYLRLINCMKKSNCRALYALSQSAYRIQKESLRENLDIEDVNLLMSKTKVLHPPQEILISQEAFEEKHRKGKIHFLFIGRNFFFKGGREMVDVLSEFEGKHDFRLTLISSLMYNDYFTKTPYEEMVKYKKIIQSKKWIDYYESLPNEQVLEKCREATVGLLPSVGDTYGYAVLEMQAAGCPVITTNVRAFPEINNEECGWICKVPVDELGFCIEQDSEVWSGILKKGLRRCFQEIFDAPEKIQKKGRKASERIQRMHDPYKYQNELCKNL